ncbi:hypothetical protein MCP1_310021 [Candidatus Terasakiella magnetica]|nr:hypothetical protein MCP1_310021 [Candidatus Terasakiella magnetica]
MYFQRCKENVAAYSLGELVGDGWSLVAEGVRCVNGVTFSWLPTVTSAMHAYRPRQKGGGEL